MPKLIAGFGFLFCISLMSCGAQQFITGQQGAPQTPQKPQPQYPPPFKELGTVLRKTIVPLRLPTFLPYTDKEHPIFASPGSVDDSHYEIYLGWDPKCEGENVCSYGSVYGGVSPFQSPQEDAARYSDEDRMKLTVEPVELGGGIKGQFIDAVCHSYCTQSYVRWSEGDFCYAVGMKAEGKEILKRVANSAIAGGRISEKR